MSIKETVKLKTTWRIDRFEDPDGVLAVLLENGVPIEAVRERFPEKTREHTDIDGNLLLEEGVSALSDLIAVGGAQTAWNNANARLGVGDSAVAEAASQTALQAAVNKLWKAMDATYPQKGTLAQRKTVWRSTFATTEANFAWNEFTVVNAVDDTGTNLNRKVSAQGTKPSTQTWVLTLEITWT